ncbi:MAG: Leucine--tRNA ligase [Chlamydiae bacterium]|nr:Leucine--tRNA ligase [Chlamydiota bacterium]
MTSKETKKKYDPEAIELKWQKRWEEEKTFKCEIDPSKKKYYILDMLPYPSGDGLHIGHPVGYTATDVLARYKRQLGFNVMHPMGWDSFGLPAEQYAVRTGVHPRITTEKNISNIRRQLKRIGFSYDWDREIKTSDPQFYKWTQYLFTKLYEKGLAYEADLLVNFCPALGTVLSNEEVIDGKSDIGGHPVERRPLRQWVLKITEYAERLLTDLEDLDWPEGIKKLQRNWIGKSLGVNVTYIEEKTQEKISVYTTRPDTLFGATFLVLSPEHPLVKSITTKAQKPAVDAYIKEVALKSDIERTELAKDKSGVSTGAFCINPLNGERIPIWVADYVLMSYGTGAVIGVPGGQDLRDFEFAKKFNLLIHPVVHPVKAPENLSLEEAIRQIDNLEICYLGEGALVNSQSESLNLNGLRKEEAKKRVIEFLEETGYGEATVNYKLRDWLFSRQRYWGEPIPILHFEDGTKRALDIDELPLMSPEVTCYQPSKTGKSPLENVRDWVEVTDPKSGKKALRETNTMPQWAGSCWYYLRYLDPQNKKEPFSKEAEKYWMPVDLYVGGAEHAVLHLLYARFWHKVFYDCGMVSTKEPFSSLRNQGVVTARSFKNSKNRYVPSGEVVEKGTDYVHQPTGEKVTSQIEKMSKSKLNGLSPDEVIEEFGSDALRLYELFMAPLDKEKVWIDNGIQGCYRFLHRFYDLCVNKELSDIETPEALKVGHTLVKGVEEDLKAFAFNTVISKLMIFINDFSKLNTQPKSVLLMAVQCLYPLAPHIACELWEYLGQTEALEYYPFCTWNSKYLQESVATYVVQVNGKLRGKFELPKDQEKEAIIALAKQNNNIAKHLEGEIVKIIFVPNKLINFVVR